MDKMKAGVVTKSGELVIRNDLPIPEVPEYGVLVRISYGATCAGTDSRLMRLQHPHPVAYPAILGHESVGRAIRCDKKVRHFHEGDLIARVGARPIPELGLGICWGGFAQYGIALDWQAMQEDGIPESQWAKSRVNKVIPNDIDERSAPMIITWRETLSYVGRLKVRAGDRVLVAGSGANALAFVCHCAYAGARTAMLGSSARGADALRCGAAAAFDYKDPQAYDKISACFPEGIDYLIDGVGKAANINMALPLLKDSGTIAVYGWDDRSGYGINPFLARHSFGVYNNGYDEPEAHDEVIRRIREGRLDAGIWYDRRHPIPLDDLQSAYDRLKKRESYKFLIDMK